jgi:hypothetical protein
MKKGTISKARYDKLKARYRLLLLWVQGFDFAIRSGCFLESAKDVFIEELREGGYLDETIKGKVKGLKEYYIKHGLA